MAANAPHLFCFTPDLPPTFKERVQKTIGVRYQETSNLQEVRTRIQENPPDIFFVQLDETNKTIWSILENLANASPETVCIGWVQKADDNILQMAVNRGHVQRILVGTEEYEAWPKLIESALSLQKLVGRQQEVLRELNAQNRQLETLTSGLEKLVLERTLSAEKSKTEVESKLGHIKGLVHFINNLSYMHSMDEILAFLRKELKSFHSVRQPVLGYTSPDGKRFLVFYQGKQISEKRIVHDWPSLSEVRVNDSVDSRFLANELGRPVTKVIAMPLHAMGQALLYLEHAMEFEEISTLQNFMRERSQTLSMAVDKIALEHHLHFSSYQWASTFDGIQDPIAIVDLGYKVIRANRHFHSIAYESTCHATFARQEKPCRNCPLPSALGLGQSSRARVRAQSRLYDVHSYPIRFENDQNLTTVINHYVDVTDAQDLYGRLVQSEKMAAIGLLAGNIAHELNNPLTGIRSLAQILMQEVAHEKNLYEDLAEVEKAAGRSQKIIENLLQFSKGEGFDKKLRVTMNDLVERTLPLLKTVLSEHRCDIQLSADDTNVVGEPQLLQQVIFNLVTNACQAMSETGEILLLTRVVVGPDSRDWVEFVVQDSGPGIPVEIQQQIFEPFFTTKVEGQGTGLGLSMCLSIVQKLGGEIRVESRPAAGACFTVRLPRNKDSL